MATCCRAQQVLSEVHHTTTSRSASLAQSTHFARISRARVSQAAANVLQTRPRVNGALRLKTVNVALLVPCQQKGVPADALPRKHAIQTNCLPQQTQKRKIAFHTLVGGSALSILRDFHGIYASELYSAQIFELEEE